jgi:SMODS and SLOG-associating 2TM effector domain 3/SMODS and SLOG-associating 2TM effector domain 1
MKEEDFPALHRSADEFSLKSQRHFFNALKLHLILLVIAAVLSMVSIPHWSVAVLQAIVLLGAFSCSIYLSHKRPDRYWYAGRAVAESIKTITWRYVCRAEPFQGDDLLAQSEFQQKLKAIVDQNKDVAQALTSYLDAPQVTEAMIKMRAQSLGERKATYASHRIKDQLTWYAKKAAFNGKKSSAFFWTLIIINGIAVLCAILRVVFVSVPFWPTDVFVAAAASLLSWMQAKRFSELAASYALAAHEIGIIREQSLQPTTDKEFSSFVGDAENAFSREHTQWVARQDV